jgi:hypothetical protein
VSRPTPSAYLSWTPTGGALQVLVFDAVVTEGWELNAEVTEHPVEVGPDIADHVRVKLALCTLEVFVSNEPVGPNLSTGRVGAPPALTSAPLSFRSPPGGVLVLSDGQLTGSSPATGTVSVTGWDSELAERSAVTSVGGFVGGGAFGTAGAIVGAALGSVAGADALGPHATRTSVDTNAGLPPPAGPPPVTAQTWQYDLEVDFAASVVDLLDALKTAAQLFTVCGSKNFRTNMVIDTLETHRDADSTGVHMTLGLKEIRIVSTGTVAAPTPSIPRAAAPKNKGPQNTKPAPLPIGSHAADLAGALVAGQQYQDGLGIPFTAGGGRSE